MKLKFLDRNTYKNKQAYFQIHYLTDKDAFFIDEGGAGADAVKGCAELIEELDETYDHLFCASGTGTTAAGLLNGIHTHHPETMLHVIPVLKNGEVIKQDILKYGGLETNLLLHLNYHFGGYAKTTTELIMFVKSITSKTGMLIDPVYTGKMFYAMNDLISKGYFEPGSKILAIHTGGLLGILGMAEKFNS